MPKKTLLYIHGMGGGADSRIPSILRENINSMLPEEFDFSVDVICKTYDFDPDVADVQVNAWFDLIKPDIVIGESMGSIHALRLKGVPHLLVSPALNAPLYFTYLSFLALIPGFTHVMDKIYKPRPGERQPLHFTFDKLKKWRRYRNELVECSPSHGNKDYFHAYFGDKDHYRKSGVVRVSTWKKYYGEDSFTMYNGTHFMEEEYIYSLLIPSVIEILSRN